MNAHDLRETDASIQTFVATIKELQWVHMIALDDTVPFARVWTIISAPPFDSAYRRPIYEAQVAALSKVTRSGIDFRVVNIQEIGNDLADLLPNTYQTLYRQEVAA